MPAADQIQSRESDARSTATDAAHRILTEQHGTTSGGDNSRGAVAAKSAALVESQTLPDLQFDHFDSLPGQHESGFRHFVHGARAVAGSVVRGAVDEVVHHPGQVAGSALTGFGIGIVAGAVALAAPEIAAGAAIVGVGFGLEKLVKHAGGWIHDAAVVGNRQDHTAEELAAANKGLHAIGGGAVLMAAGAFGGIRAAGAIAEATAVSSESAAADSRVWNPYESRTLKLSRPESKTVAANSELAAVNRSTASARTDATTTSSTQTTDGTPKSLMPRTDVTTTPSTPITDGTPKSLMPRTDVTTTSPIPTADGTPKSLMPRTDVTTKSLTPTIDGTPKSLTPVDATDKSATPPADATPKSSTPPVDATTKSSTAPVDATSKSSTPDDSNLGLTAEQRSAMPPEQFTAFRESVAHNQALYRAAQQNGELVPSVKQSYSVRFEKVGAEGRVVQTLENPAGVTAKEGDWVATRLNSDGTPNVENGLVNSWTISPKSIQKTYLVTPEQLNSQTDIVGLTNTNGAPVGMVRLEAPTDIQTSWGPMHGNAGDWLSNYDFDPATGKAGHSFAIVTARSYQQTYRPLMPQN